MAEFPPLQGLEEAEDHGGLDEAGQGEIAEEPAVGHLLVVGVPDVAPGGEYGDGQEDRRGDEQPGFFEFPATEPAAPDGVAQIGQVVKGEVQGYTVEYGGGVRGEVEVCKEYGHAEKEEEQIACGQAAPVDGGVGRREKEAAEHHGGEEPQVVVALDEGINKIVKAAEAAGGQAAQKGVGQRPEAEEKQQPQWVPYKERLQLQLFPGEEERPGEHEEHRHAAPQHGAYEAEGQEGRGVQGADMVQLCAGVYK